MKWLTSSSNAENADMQTYKTVDVQAVNHKSPLDAVKTFQIGKPTRTEHCDVLIVGGGLGGVATALHTVFPTHLLDDSGNKKSSQRNKLKVVLTEETDWLGGQATSQGVSAFDENWLVESSGATSEYQRLRSLIRRHYIRNFKLNSSVGNLQYFDPGKCWVSRLAFEPKVAIEHINHMLSPAIEAGNLTVHLRLKTLAVNTIQSNGKTRIKSVLMVNLDTGESTEFLPDICIDATELGDLLPLAGLPYSSGAESKSETGEDHAPEVAEPDTVQDIVYPFVISKQTNGPTETLEVPAEYEEFKSQGKFSLLGYKMYSNAQKKLADGTEQELLPFWTYRRLIASENFHDSRLPTDISMINWEANDFRGENIIDVDPETMAKRLARAKSQSLGFHHWLKTEAPRDDGEGTGYPEFRLRFDTLGTKDGLSKYPYIRESRRIKGEALVTEKHVGKSFNPGARAHLFSDTVGIGLYPIDIHGKQIAGAAQGTKPFQVPLGALIPKDCDNLLAGCKNIGVTHIANGAYRLHPIEWAIGTACGALARLSVTRGKPLHKFLQEPSLTFSLQKTLVESGSPLYWYDDVPTWHEQFLEIQLLAVSGLMPGHPEHLSFNPDSPLTRREVAVIMRALMPKTKYSKFTLSDVALAEPGYEPLSFCASKGILEAGEQGNIRPDANLTISELAKMAKNALLRLPHHRNVFIEVLSAERIESAPLELVTRSEFALWLALLVDYKKLWHEIDTTVLNAGVVRTKTGIRDLPVSAP
jgi:hypothetical protein